MQRFLIVIQVVYIPASVLYRVDVPCNCNAESVNFFVVEENNVIV
jgi:hypothetical protein